jgi:hypothetical protein
MNKSTHHWNIQFNTAQFASGLVLTCGEKMLQSNQPGLYEPLVAEEISVTKHKVWLLLSRRHQIARMKEMVPHDAYVEMNMYATELLQEFSLIERQCLDELSAIDFDKSEETILGIVSDSENCEILRMMLYGQDYAPNIWKIIEPEK